MKKGDFQEEMRALICRKYKYIYIYIYMKRERRGEREMLIVGFVNECD